MSRATCFIAVFLAVIALVAAFKVGTEVPDVNVEGGIFRVGVSKINGVEFGDMPVLSAAEIVGHGFNALTSQHGAQSGLLSVVAWTYQFNQTWTSPVSGTSYKVPDQLTLSNQPASSLKIVQEMTDSYSSVFTTYTSSFHFSLGVNFANAFGASVDYSHELQKAHSEMKNHSQYNGYSHYWASYYQLVAPPAYVLGMYPSPQFRLALMGLPSSIKTSGDKNRYGDFVTVYGTHYVCIGLFGGRVNEMSFLDKKVANSHSSSQVSTQFGLKFHYEMYDISAGGFKNRSSIKNAAWFAENAHTYNYFTGGNPALQTNNSVGSWMKSIPDNAALINSTLCPLSDLITNDDTKQKTMYDYIKLYLS